MTPDKHMQKAREVADAVNIHPSDNLRIDIIATALSEAYRSGVEEERERAVKIAEHGTLVRGDSEWDAGHRLASESIAAAIRTTKAD